MWLFVILSVIVFAVVLLHVITDKKYNWPSTWEKISKIPGPRGIPFFGNSFAFLVSNEEYIPTLVKFTDQYGPVWKAEAEGHLFVFLTDPPDVELILGSKNHITKGTDYNLLVPWLGTGLLISSGKKWADHRKWLTPAFHFGILETRYMDIMNKNANTLLKILENQLDSPVDINTLISHCALDIICETAMGTQVNAQLGGQREYVHAVIRMSYIFTKRLLSVWLRNDWLFNMSHLGKEHKKNLAIVHGFTEKVIKERKAAFRKEQNAKSENLHQDNTEKKKMSFLDLLIEISCTQNLLTEEEIREEVDTFMFEGHDTTAAAMSWALLQLALHPEIQEKAYQEQWEIFQGTDREPTFSDLLEMKYLERVIKETLRLFPSVPIFSRKLEEDVKVGRYTIPAEAQVPIFVYYIHRNPKIYPEPKKFNPDRFLPEASRKRHPYSYLPFSAGSRNCIGQKFAMMEEKIVLSHILRKFRFSNVTNPADIVPVGEVLLRPKENFQLAFTKRRV